MWIDEVFKNAEGYWDTTAGAAIARVEREERLKKRLERESKENYQKPPKKADELTTFKPRR